MRKLFSKEKEGKKTLVEIIKKETMVKGKEKVVKTTFTFGEDTGFVEVIKGANDRVFGYEFKDDQFDGIILKTLIGNNVVGVGHVSEQSMDILGQLGYSVKGVL